MTRKKRKTKCKTVRKLEKYPDCIAFDDNFCNCPKCGICYSSFLVGCPYCDF